jgi:hypothetical protein
MPRDSRPRPLKTTSKSEEAQAGEPGRRGGEAGDWEAELVEEVECESASFQSDQFFKFHQPIFLSAPVFTPVDYPLRLAIAC